MKILELFFNRSTAPRPSFPAVHSLFVTGRPSAILRRIGSIVVNSVKTQFTGRSLSHIRKKVFERIIPAVADRDSSPTVIAKGAIIRIVAAITHTDPGCILRSIGRHVTAIAVAIAYDFPTQTSARLRKPFTQRNAIDPFFCAAVTLTKPQGAPANNFVLIGDCPPSESFFRKINKPSFSRGFRTQTSARFGVPARKMPSLYPHLFSALALTKPQSASVHPHVAIRDEQPSELLTREIDKLHNTILTLAFIT